MEIFDKLNGRWDQGSANEILELAEEFFTDWLEGGPKTLPKDTKDQMP